MSARPDLSTEEALAASGFTPQHTSAPELCAQLGADIVVVIGVKHHANRGTAGVIVLSGAADGTDVSTESIKAILRLGAHAAECAEPIEIKRPLQ